MQLVNSCSQEDLYVFSVLKNVPAIGQGKQFHVVCAIPLCNVTCLGPRILVLFTVFFLPQRHNHGITGVETDKLKEEYGVVTIKTVA
jgi:hypothetical protein